MAEKEKVDKIYFSGNSLNNLSIMRYIKNMEPQSLNTSLIPPNYQPDFLQQGDFLFVSHMGEKNQFVSYKTFQEDFGKKVINLKNYVPFATLPYNKLWKRQIRERGKQDYAVSIYVVRNQLN